MDWLELQSHPFLHSTGENQDGIFIQVIHVFPVVDTTAQPCTNKTKTKKERKNTQWIRKIHESQIVGRFRHLFWQIFGWDSFNVSSYFGRFVAPFPAISTLQFFSGFLPVSILPGFLPVIFSLIKTNYHHIQQTELNSNLVSKIPFLSSSWIKMATQRGGTEKVGSGGTLCHRYSQENVNLSQD